MPSKDTENKKLNIYERMSAITTEISAVAKNLNVGFGKASYKAVGEADVLAAVKPIEAKHGVYSYPLTREIIDSGIIENTKNDGSISKSQFLRLATTYRFVNTDDPQDYIDITTYGDGVDTQDKAPGKAMTYSDKYALLKAYKIITGDDPDQIESGELKSYKSKQSTVSSPQSTGNVVPPQPVESSPYPSKEDMIKTCKDHYTGDNLKKLLDYYKVDAIEKLSDAQLMVAYNMSVKGKK
jgi:hypothetical protein